MINVLYPDPQFKLKKEGDATFIFDAIRKTWVILTEEEWVRQNFINYLITQLNYPATVIALEKEIKLNGLKKRFDILIYNQQHSPWMLIECKAPHINLTEDTLQQVLRYNISVPVKFIITTNGKATIGWKKQGNELKLITQLPRWNNPNE